MNAELEAIKDAWAKDTGNGREEDGTRALCDAYVAAHPEQFTELANMTLEQCVQSVSLFRQASFDPTQTMAFKQMGVDPEESQWKVEVWLLHNFEPQNIGGPLQARIRLPAPGGR